ncbi:unnamed protein product [Sphagnum troendelagicum]|uniref:Uncharacterized protein n=1 Tax=Sphagnum troendelagicum TaxID=128251 RepID=A0ABP0UJQ0_9BRYO
MKFGSRSAVFDGVLLALIEGAGIMLDRVNQGSDEKPSVELQQHLHQLQLLPPHFPLHFKELHKSRHRRRSISANANRAPTSLFPLVRSVWTTTTPTSFADPPPNIELCKLRILGLLFVERVQDRDAKM